MPENPTLYDFTPRKARNTLQASTTYIRLSDIMTLNSRTGAVRHSIRPLNTFSFCGRPIAAPREYLESTKDLPPCPECKRARDKAALTVAGAYRRRG